MKDAIRVSQGSAVELGLAEGRLAARPRTLYLLLSHGGCRGGCAFCPQSMGGASDRVSRIGWPSFPLASVLRAVRSTNAMERICLQCTDEGSTIEELPALVRRLVGEGGLPVSVSLPPTGAGVLGALKVAGAERVTIPLDCASPRLFTAVKGRRMGDCLRSLRGAAAIFGKGAVGSHIIVGLGESEEEVVSACAGLWAMGVLPSLFAFMPVRGTPMEGRGQPPIPSYRRLQLALHMIVELGLGIDSFTFDDSGRLVTFPLGGPELASVVKGGKPFETKGCPGCNRPYFNERASGPLFNFPYRPSRAEIKCIEEELFGKASAD